MRLAGKVAIVVGAGQASADGLGNGRATALAFAREGADLLLVNKSEGSLKDTIETIGDRWPDAKVEPLVADIGEEDACARIVATACDRFARIDVVHNNVGLGLIEGTTTSIDLALWQQVLQANVTGAMLLSKYVLPVMVRDGGGVITHVGAVAATVPCPFYAYNVSKLALQGIVSQIHYEHRRNNIRCNLLTLGLIETPMALDGYSRLWPDRSRDQIRQERDALVPWGRMGRPEEAAEAAVFLASDDSVAISGQSIVVDGGYLAGVELAGC